MRHPLQNTASQRMSLALLAQIGELITPSDPASLVKNKEETFRASGMTKFMRKPYKKRKSKEEWEALFKEHPRPDVDAYTSPKAVTL